MNYVDTFFKIPIRVYDEKTTLFNMKAFKEATSDEDISIEGDWISGFIRIKPEDIDNWMDYFDSNKGIDGVKSEGFTETLVLLKKDSFICLWNRNKFEENLNKYMSDFEKK